MDLAQLVHDLNQSLKQSDPIEGFSEAPLPTCTAQWAVRWEDQNQASNPSLDFFLATSAEHPSKESAPRFGMERLFGPFIPFLASLSTSGSLSFPDTKVNNSSFSKNFSVSNSSDCSVYVSASSSNSVFSVFPGSTTISGNSSANFSVTFTPTFEGSYSASISVSGGGSSSSVSASGRGVK